MTAREALARHPFSRDSSDRSGLLGSAVPEPDSNASRSAVVIA